jgi:hypothetical protein
MEGVPDSRVGAISSPRRYTEIEAARLLETTVLGELTLDGTFSEPARLARVPSYPIPCGTIIGEAFLSDPILLKAVSSKTIPTVKVACEC